MKVPADKIELAVDPARPTGRTLLAGGVEQSYVDVADPTYLRFDYVRRMAAVADLAAPAGDPLRVLRPDGIYLVNVTDLPPLVITRVQVATLRTAFADICAVADRRMLRGRRYGNVVLAAACHPDRLPVARLAVRALRDATPGGVLHGPTLDRFVAGARPRTEDNHRGE